MAKPSSSTPGKSPLRFVGSPYLLSAVVHDLAEDADISITAEPKRMMARASKLVAAQPLVAEASRDVDPRMLRLTLPPRTPPGRYEGTALVAGQATPVVIDVEPLHDLRVVPQQLRLDVQPGDKLQIELSILNNGNVPLELRSVAAFGVFFEGGLERALRITYKRTPAVGSRRVDVFADTLAEAHGGLVKLKWTSDISPIHPGQIRSLTANLSIPTRLKPGHTYTGNLELPGLVYPVRLELAGEPPESDNLDGDEE